MTPPSDRFAVASFGRCGHDNFARALEKRGLLDFYALGTRKGTQGVTPEHTRLQPIFGLLNYAGAKLLPPFQCESFRFRLYPLFDQWVKSLLRPKQHLITSYSFANSAMHKARRLGGKTFIDAQNSHPTEFMELLEVERRKFNSPYPPVANHYYRRSLATTTCADYVFAPSTFVRDSFLKYGFKPEQLLLYPLPLNLDWFRPTTETRPKDRPLTVINTGSLCLRKGTPYLLEAFRLILKSEPRAVLRLTNTIRNDAAEVMRRYSDLPIDWAPYYNLSSPADREQYARRFQTSDIFVFPSIEDGFGFVVAEALACGLPVITTRNTGASDLVKPGENGEIVPIRDPEAIAKAVLQWWAGIQQGRRVGEFEATKKQLSFATFEETVIGHLQRLGLVASEA